MKYYSEKLNKMFDTEEELKAAEEEKENKVALRKADADVVKKAITARVEAQIAARQAKLDAYKAYLAACDEAEQKVEEAKKEEKIRLSEFCEKHPEGFHDTIKIGDMTYNYNYSTKNHINCLDPFIKLLGWF